MIKHLLLLNGTAILAVVFNHAAGWGYIAMFQWADRYRPVTAPNYDQIGSLPYYLLLIIKCLTPFAIPAFLFVSGFFVAYSARSNQSTLTWNMVNVRLKHLLIPYLFWSVVIFIGNALEGITYTFSEYLKYIIIGGAHPVYFYIPLICQFYLLSPVIVPFGKTNAVQLLFISALIQLGALSISYLAVFGMVTPTVSFTAELLFPMYIFFFTFGIVSCFHLQPIRLWLVKVKWVLVIALLIFGGLAILESEVVYHLTGIRRGGGPNSILTSVYTITFIMCFFAFYKASIPFSKFIQRLGSASFGIYLLHPKILEFVARVIQKFIPLILPRPLLFQFILVLVAIGMPLLFMAIVAQSKMRWAYRYLFG